MLFDKVCVYGGGVIGGTWAINFVLKGVSVTLYDLEDQKLDDTKKEIEKNLNVLAAPEVNVISPEKIDEYIKMISFTTDVKTAVAGMPLIQECVPERIDIKRSAVKTIEQFNTAGIIASSTTGMSIDDIASEAAFPERMIVGHPYNPVHLMPLVEVVKGEKTSQDTVDKILAFYKELGKEPVLLNKYCPGFICSRIQAMMLREGMSLIMRGICSVEDFDKAVTFGPSLRWAIMGPHLVLNVAAGKNAASGAVDHLGGGAASYLSDLSTATEFDPNYLPIAFQGLMEELEHRTPEQGQDIDGLERFRDKGLIQLLKYHGKL